MIVLLFYNNDSKLKKNSSSPSDNISMFKSDAATINHINEAKLFGGNNINNARVGFEMRMDALEESINLFAVEV